MFLVMEVQIETTLIWVGLTAFVVISTVWARIYCCCQGAYLENEVV